MGFLNSTNFLKTPCFFMPVQQVLEVVPCCNFSTGCWLTAAFILMLVATFGFK
jgi:hypothetical protein